MDNENIIYVDADTREAVLHSNFKIGVVNDDSCHTLTFRINKASDIDLTDLTFYVNTTSARGNGDKLDCTKEEDDSYIFVKCILKGTLFEAKGKATINLCGRKYDSNNTIIKKWGSEDISVIVGSHTDADKAIEERYPSVLEDLKHKVENLNITDAQLNTIATKVAEKGFYTKTEVDALIAKIAVPTKLSQLTEDDSHVTVTKAQKTKIDNVPTQFKTINNQPITGTGNITIPTGGTGTSITVDSALSATSNNPVANKAVTNALNTKAEKSELGIDIVNTSQSTITMQTGKYYVFGEMASINVTCEATPSGKAFICGFEFTSGAAPTSLTLNKCTLTSDSDDVVANKKYEVNILNGSAIVRAR